MISDDAQLMLAYVKGDAAAFEQLYARHKVALYQFVLNSCNEEARASELFQDVWLKVVKSRATYQAQSPFNAWLFRIARNCLIDHYRQQGRIPRMDSIDDDSKSNVVQLTSPMLSPEQIATLTQRHGTLNSALYTLPDVQREAVLLRHIAGMSIAEIAIIVETGTETVKSRLRYAIVRLRSLLENTL